MADYSLDGGIVLLGSRNHGKLTSSLPRFCRFLQHAQSRDAHLLYLDGDSCIADFLLWRRFCLLAFDGICDCARGAAP